MNPVSRPVVNEHLPRRERVLRLRSAVAEWSAAQPEAVQDVVQLTVAMADGARKPVTEEKLLRQALATTQQTAAANLQGLAGVALTLAESGWDEADKNHLKSVAVRHLQTSNAEFQAHPFAAQMGEAGDLLKELSRGRTLEEQATTLMSAEDFKGPAGLELARKVLEQPGRELEKEMFSALTGNVFTNLLGKPELNCQPFLSQPAKSLRELARKARAVVTDKKGFERALDFFAERSPVDREVARLVQRAAKANHDDYYRTNGLRSGFSQVGRHTEIGDRETIKILSSVLDGLSGGTPEYDVPRMALEEVKDPSFRAALEALPGLTTYPHRVGLKGAFRALGQVQPSQDPVVELVRHGSKELVSSIESFVDGKPAAKVTKTDWVTDALAVLAADARDPRVRNTAELMHQDLAELVDGQDLPALESIYRVTRPLDHQVEVEVDVDALTVGDFVVRVQD